METLRLGVDEFQLLREVFGGGHTHAGNAYIGVTLKHVGSHDITSSYPAVMCYEKFPMSTVTKVPGIKGDCERFRELLKTKCCMFDVIMKNVRPKLNYEHPISRSKCWLFEMELSTVKVKAGKKKRTKKKKVEVLDNGRVVRATLLGISVTEQDFFTYEEFYDFEIVSINNFHYYEKQYLPHAFVETVLEFYGKKTLLKGVVGEEVNYMKAKEMTNSSYGMAVTNPLRDEVEYTDDHIYKKVPPVLEEAISKYNDNVRRFLFYPWGVWVTAYARRRLFKGIKAVGEDFVYADTDSVKYLNPEKHEQFFADYNNEILEQIQAAAKYHHISPSLFSPLNKILGVWENEGIMDEFKTLGAKRYFYRKGDKYYATIAGANKKGAADYLSQQPEPFEAFNENLVIPPEYSKRMTLKYIDEETSGWVTDYRGERYHYYSPSGIHMEPTSYSMGLSEEFYAFLRETMLDGWK